MELNSDWKAFRSIFHPRKRVESRRAAPPVLAILDESSAGEGEETIVAAYAEAEDLSDWMGATKTDFYNGMGDRKVVFISKTEMDEGLLGSLGMPHYLDQLENLRATLVPAEAESGVFFKRHFFLEGVRGWWSKVLPSAYGVFIRLEGQGNEDIFVLVRRGRVETYGRPDLSSLGIERSRDPEQIIKYLSEKHVVPVQGFFLDSQSWQEWMDSPQAWRKVALSIRSERTRMVPFRWGLVSLIASRGFLGI